jgi:hypothetical protein
MQMPCKLHAYVIDDGVELADSLLRLDYLTSMDAKRANHRGEPGGMAKDSLSRVLRFGLGLNPD